MADDLLTLAAIGGGGLLVGHLLARRTDARAHADAAAQVAAAYAATRPRPRPAARPAPVATTAPRPAPSPAPAPRGLSRAFDRVFADHGQGLPVAYLRSLAARESGLSPMAAGSRAIGLLQVMPVVLRDFNRRHGASYTARDLVDPTVNVTIAATALRTIVDSYARNHPDVPNLHEDWTNLAFVELVTLGWNAGWSETRGVGRVVRYLNDELKVYETVTIDTVASQAKFAGATRHLADPRKVAWCKGVVQLYARERDRDDADALAPGEAAP